MFLQVIDNYELDYINQPINFLQINIFSKFNSILLFLLWNIFWNQTIYISLIKFKTFLIHDREIVCNIQLSILSRKNSKK